MTTAPVLRAAHVSCPPERAFAAFTDQIGAWWPLASHGLFGVGATLGFEGDLLVERDPAGQETAWAEVTAWEPPSRLVLQWHPGLRPDQASEVEVTFTGDEDGTRVDLVHRGWERFGEDAAARRASYAGPRAWGVVLDHLAHLIDQPEHPDEEGLAALAAAYESFFETARGGGFGPPPAGEWDAAQVVAHVALNDMAMARVARELVEGTAPDFENLQCQDPAVLADLIGRCGSMESLVEEGRRHAAVAQAVLRRLDADQRDTEVAVRLHHDRELVVEDARPWWQLAVHTQASLHLPAHSGQLTDLRGR